LITFIDHRHPRSPLGTATWVPLRAEGNGRPPTSAWSPTLRPGAEPITNHYRRKGARHSPARDGKTKTMGGECRVSSCSSTKKKP
jgi:hypothetical protein